MKKNGIHVHANEMVFLALLILGLILEFQSHFIEKSVGLYLKWQNDSRPQLGRMWDRDRENLVAQRKIQNILTSLDSQRQSNDSITSFRQIFENLFPGNSQIISREKFLQLYYDYPGEWSKAMISPFDLMEIDSSKNWNRVLFGRRGIWVTISFIDTENLPIDELHLSLDMLGDTNTARVVQKGNLEDLDFDSERIFPFSRFIQILKTLDPDSRKMIFPDPQWFLEKDYQVTRVGFSEVFSPFNIPESMLFGIEYQTDYYPSILKIRVPLEMAYNILSQFEKDESETSNVSSKKSAEPEAIPY